MQRSKRIISNTALDIQARALGNTVAQILLVGCQNRIKSIIRRNSLCISVSFRIEQLTHLERIITSTTINIGRLGGTIDSYLVITSIGIQVDNIDTARKVDTFNIFVANFILRNIGIRQ